MKSLILAILLSGCAAATPTPAVTIEVPVGAGAQCFDLPGTIRVSYYNQDGADPLALKVGKAFVDFGFVDQLWSFFKGN